MLGGNSGGNYTVTLDVNSAALDSLTINFSNGTSVATLAIGSKTLNVNGSGSGATDTVSVTGINAITIAGGTINAGTVSLAASGTSLSGFGTLNISGHYTGTGTLQASGGTLDVFGTVDSGLVLAMNAAVASTLKIEGAATAAAAISITSATQTLEIGSSGSLTINAAQTVTAGTVQLDGSSSLLTDAERHHPGGRNDQRPGQHRREHQHHRFRHGERPDIRRRHDHGQRRHPGPDRNGKRPDAGDRQPLRARC